jgi:hypothetical protein
MMRSSKVFWILILSLSLIPITGGTSLVIASSGPSHSTHLVADKGPHISLDETGCYVCHAEAGQQCGEDGPFFKSGIDGNGDDKYNLSETDSCNPCHSEDGVIDGVAMAKQNWDLGVYEIDDTLISGKEMWCISCHDSGTSQCDGVDAPDISGDNTTYGYYVNGHKSRLCSDCHDLTVTHIDGEARTYAFDSGDYLPGESGVAYAAGYRLKSMGTDVPGGYNESVPLMIPTNFGTTFNYVGLDIKDNAFRLCFSCHDSAEVLDDTPGDGLDTNFKASLPDLPQSYSYAWSAVEDTNQHFYHTINQTMQLWDSDWDIGTSMGVGEGNDSIVSCSSCHNVHGAAGAEGSTNEPMIRDGSLAGRTGFGFSYVIEDVGIGGYPVVTSAGASLPISVGAVFRNGNVMCSSPICHMPPPLGQGSTSYDATGSGSGTYLEYYRAVGTFSCSDCHAYGTESSHPTHADSTGKGVDLGCYDCHDSSHANNTVDFPDGDLSTTTTCDDCHSTGGTYGGVTTAKGNWVDGIYEPDGVTFQTGKDQWCAGCHDDEPANSMADGTGIWAPSITGDSAEIYGYYISGHGRPSANLTCDVCHDLTRTHIDHDPRTYDVNESSAVGNDISAYAGHGYRLGYRLKAGLDMPRNSYDDDYYLCTNCHQAVMGTKTNFRYPSGGGDNLHGTHIGGFGSLDDWGWDSDADGEPVGTYPGDSWMSCTGCHNVHGSPMDVHYDDVLTANPVMVRYGELTDAVPGLNFRWFTGSNATGASTDKRNDSLSATVSVVQPFCSSNVCHVNPGRIYDRTPYIFLPGFLVDDFESYGSDEAIQAVWGNKYDAKTPYFEIDAGPDGSRCMRIRTLWSKNEEDHGIFKRVYNPYVQMGYMESMSFQLRVDKIDKITQIGVMLKVYPEEIYHEVIVDTADLQNFVWFPITIPLSSFGIDPFDKLTEVRFRTYELSPLETWVADIYIDDIQFTPASYTISGQVTGGSVGPLDGVIMRGFPGDNVVTSGGGFYSATVYDTWSGWTGTVTPEKPGYFFDPVETPYTNVTSDLVDQDYTPSLDTSAIISESFEGIGYEEEDWSESIGTNCVLDADYSPIPGTPPVDFGLECLKSLSDDTGYKARADMNYGYTFEQPRTFTTFYCRVEAESLAGDEFKNIGVFLDNGGDQVAVLRLYKTTGGDLTFRMRHYNNGGYTNFDSEAIPPNEWHKIQFMYDNSEDTWEWRVNGAVQEGSGELTGTHRTGIREWRIGFWQSSQAVTGTMYFDNFSVGIGTYVAD